MARQLGFERCAIVVRYGTVESCPDVITQDDYTRLWRHRYRAQKYAAIDPVVHDFVYAKSPVIWSSATLAAAPELWRDMCRHGLSHGCSIPIRDESGYGVVVSMARRQGGISSCEFERLRHEVTWLVETAYLALIDAFADCAPSQQTPRLSEREVEVLRWSGEGKTTAQIASLLTISNHTVNFHLRNAASKLNSLNKTQAVMQAIRLGLIY